MDPVTLPEAMQRIQTYRLVENGAERGIQCLVCGLTSWHPQDVAQRYCGCCHQFHELRSLMLDTRDWCPPDCGHSAEEHQAFDAGYDAGQQRRDEDACPYTDFHLREIWRIGHSVTWGASALGQQDLLSEVIEAQAQGELYRRRVADGRVVVVLPLLFGAARIGVSPADFDDGGFTDVWEYTVAAEAVAAATRWDPATQEAPYGWTRHPESGRRRPDGDASQEYVEL